MEALMANLALHTAFRSIRVRPLSALAMVPFCLASSVSHAQTMIRNIGPG